MIRAHFDGSTVPALAVDGERILGSRAILHRLDELEPEPRLVPREPELRPRVLEAEAWGDEVLQPLVRRIAWAGLRRDVKAMLSYAAGSKTALPARNVADLQIGSAIRLLGTFGDLGPLIAGAGARGSV